jgi:SM-20-related protein
VKWCRFTAGNGCEGPQPSRPAPIIVATNGWATACYFGGQDTNEQQRWNPFEVTFKVDAVTLDLELFERTPLNPEPFEYLVVQEFVKREARDGIIHDYPKVQKPGSFPLSEMTFGPRFKELIDDLNSAEFRSAFERKFSMDLTGRPTMITVRGRCSEEKDGKIHTDSKSKIITVLLYLNPTWENGGGRLRLLKSKNDLDDMILEVPPVDGTLLAFKRSDNSWHGHKPFTGERRVIQFNWVCNEEVAHREQSRHRFSATMKKIFGLLAARG